MRVVFQQHVISYRHLVLSKVLLAVNVAGAVVHLEIYQHEMHCGLVKDVLVVLERYPWRHSSKKDGVVGTNSLKLV